MDLVGLAGVPHQRDRRAAPDGRSSYIRPALRAVCIGRHCREDDLDAPDLLVEPSPTVAAPTHPDPNLSPRKPSNGSVYKPRQPKPVLAAQPSAALRDQLLAEIAKLNQSDDLALWAHRRLPAKNTLAADDARAVEAAYQLILDDVPRAAEGQADQVLRPPSDFVQSAL